MAKTTARQSETSPGEPDAFTWWSWRPGISPRVALLIGLPLVFLALFFMTVGLLDLVYGISDSNASPIQVNGLVLGYSINGFNQLPQLTIRLDQSAIIPANAATVSVPLSPDMHKAIHAGDRVMLDYSPRLRNLYALQDGAARFDIPGSSAVGSLLGTILLFLLGCLLLPYPLFLTLGGWHDLQSPARQVTGRIVGLRAPPTRLRRAAFPGLTPRIARSWYGVAIQPSGGTPPQATCIFRIHEDDFLTLREGQHVCMNYTPRLQNVQVVRQVDRL